MDWNLLPQNTLSTYGVELEDHVYIDYGVGSWSMEALENGKYDVSYRLVMDPGGWIPGSVSNYFNRVSIVGIFQDAITETRNRAGGMTQ